MLEKFDQTDLIKAFSEGRVEHVELIAPPIQTHLSYVFLTKDRAYKLKRDVALPFVDFSTTEARQKGCLAELRVNQLFASAMYIGVRPILHTNRRHYQLGETETDAVDWVVEMHRFKQENQFDELIKADRLDADLLHATANMISKAHAAADIVTLSGHAADYRAILHELLATEQHGAQQMGMRASASDIFERMDMRLAQIDPLIEARRRAGKVRRTHGDLHLRNICLFEGQPTPFDALEFSDQLATTDTLYDLAFLLMDLVRLNRREEANLILNRYWDSSGESETAHAVMPFFLALRALVRMAVDVEAGELAEANAYRELAKQFLRHRRPVTIAIGGLSGTGKSTIAKRLASRLPGALGARVLRSDVIRKRSKGVNRSETLNSVDDYSIGQRHQIYEMMFATAKEVVGAEASCILDATFQEAEMRARAGAKLDASFQGIWLNAPLSLRLERISGRPKGASDADEAVARAQIEPETLPSNWRRVDATDAPDQVVTRVLSLIG